VAFIFGILIGFTACYAIFPPYGADPGPVDVASLPPDEPAPAQEPPEEPTPPPVTEAPPEPVEPAESETPPEPGSELAMLEDPWAARHLFVAIKGTKLDDATRDLLAELKPGGVVLISENITNKVQTIGFIKSIKDAVGLGKEIDSLPLIAVAQEGGEQNPLRLSDAPSAARVGERRDIEYARAVGMSYADSCADRGIGVLLAPSLDVYAPDAPEAIRVRTLDADYQTVRSLGLAFAQGVTQGGVIPVAKHFPGIGAATGDGRETLAVLPSEVPLEEVVFPFNEVVTRGGPGILVGHVAVPAFDTESPNRPASLSPKMLSELVRGTWNYSGVIIADNLAAPAITQTIPVEEAAVQAFAAGCDAALLLDPSFDTIRAVVKAIDDAVNAGVLNRAALGDSKVRLDAWQQWLRKPSPSLIGEIPPLPPVQVAGETVTPPTPTAPLEPARTHTVVSGDTLFGVAQTYGVTIQQLQEWNNMKGTTLRIGQSIIVSTAAQTPEPAMAPPVPEETQVVPDESPVVSDETPAEPEAPAPADNQPETPDSAMPPEEVPEEAPELETTPPAPAPEQKTTTHTVKSGEFLATIADQYGVSYQDIMRWNNLSNTNIRVGQKLSIHSGGEPEASAPEPEPAEQKYTVQRGDFLGKIADQHGVTVRQLMEWNDLSSIDIQVGQVLVIRK
jgi:beta-N-acetylhexosaminidase